MIKKKNGTVNLSARQREVLALMGEGLANKQIGRELGIAASTVKQHVQAILKEFSVSSRLEAVVFAYRYGILGQRPPEAPADPHVPAAATLCESGD